MESTHFFVVFRCHMSPFADTEFITEEVTGCINEEAIVPINEAAKFAIVAPRNPPSSFFIPCFTVSVAPSVNIL